MTIGAQSVGKAQSPFPVREPIYLNWDNFLQDWSQNQAPEGLKTLFHTAGHFWAMIEGEKAFFRNAVNGISMSVSFAFLVLIFATMNVVVTLFAVMSVAFVCASVVAVMVFNGWEMGASESVAVVVIIGFSVDYVCHLAAHYVHSAEKLRYDRATESVAHMAVSIFSGGITTFGSGIFLQGASIMFFKKFALIIIATVCFSLAYALLYF